MLTQSGLLAELMRYERRKAIESAERRTHRRQGRGFFGNSLSWLADRCHGVTTPRHS